MKPTQDLNVVALEPLITPRDLKVMCPMTEAANATVIGARDEVMRVLAGRDQRLLVMAGPCSIHDADAALEYAARLAALRRELAGELCILMRVYFEKPRSTVGWRGLINDPDLDGSCQINKGLAISRRLLLAINELGLPVATEVLDPIVPQYTADLVSWAAIGARTTESQTHRDMTSGLSMPVGFKNGTSGNLQIAIDAMVAARAPHTFLGVDQDGRTALVRTRGNPWSHIVLRGGSYRPNYDEISLQQTAEALAESELPPRIMIDCSHANSGKRAEHQPRVMRSVLSQRLAGNRAIIGVMLESNLGAGSQKIVLPRERLTYGVSVTDGCIDWDTTAALLREASAALRGSLQEATV